MAARGNTTGRLRITVAGLVGLVAALAGGLAALRNASAGWAAAVRLLALGLLGLAVLGVACGRGRRRAWWLGFALFGLGYEVLASAPWPSPVARASRALLDELYWSLSPLEVVAIDPFAAHAMMRDERVYDRNPPPGSFRGVARGSDAIVTIGAIDAVAFRAIGHHLLALVAAALGGVLAGWIHGFGPSPSQRRDDRPDWIATPRFLRPR